jgi:hypothetical protein
MAMTEVLAQSSVLPSAGERATASVAMMPLPPTRFSTTNCWPNASLRREAASRPITSILPPAANGTRTFTGRCGQFCACPAVAPAITASVTRTSPWTYFIMLSPRRGSCETAHAPSDPLSLRMRNRTGCVHAV